jgi:haloalkane dehalogenase
LAPIAARGRRVIALDLPGFGKSDKPVDSTYSFPFFERIIDGFLTVLEVDRLGMAVHDLGGPVGLYWASKRTHRLVDLSILNTIVFPEPSWAVALFVAATRVAGLRHLLSSPAGIGFTLRLGVVDKTRIDQEILAAYRDPFVSKEDRTALLKAGHGLHPRGFERIMAALPEVKCPVRVIFGKRDRLLPDIEQTVARIATLVPHAEVTAIENCGHFLQEDRPQEVAEMLAGFFARFD